MNTGRSVGSHGGWRTALAVGMMLAVTPCARAAGAAEDPTTAASNRYRNFDVALYCSIQDMRRMAADPEWMKESWDLISRSLKVDKVWLETFRAGEQTSEADVRKVKAFFDAKGVKTSGGMMCYLGRPG